MCILNRCDVDGINLTDFISTLYYRLTSPIHIEKLITSIWSLLTLRISILHYLCALGQRDLQKNTNMLFIWIKWNDSRHPEMYRLHEWERSTFLNHEDVSMRYIPSASAKPSSHKSRTPTPRTRHCDWDDKRLYLILELRIPFGEYT